MDAYALTAVVIGFTAALLFAYVAGKGKGESQTREMYTLDARLAAKKCHRINAVDFDELKRLPDKYE